MLKLLELIIFMFSSKHHFKVNTLFGKLFGDIINKKPFLLIIFPVGKVLMYFEEEDDT